MLSRTDCQQKGAHAVRVWDVGVPVFHFVRGPREVLVYLLSLQAGQPRRYLGHNPAGGAMIVLILILLLAVAVSGWLSTSDAFFGVPWVDHLHHISGHLLMILVGVHVCGLIVSSYLHGENLLLTHRPKASHAYQ